MKKKNMKILWAVGGALVIGGVGYYFWKKSQETAPITTAGYLGAHMLPGRTWPLPGVVDHAVYNAGAYATGHR